MELEFKNGYLTIRVAEAKAGHLSVFEIRDFFEGKAAPKKIEAYAPYKRPSESWTAFLTELPDRFTTGEAVELGESLGIGERAVKRFMRDNESFSKIRHGEYRKQKETERAFFNGDQLAPKKSRPMRRAEAVNATPNKELPTLEDLALEVFSAAESFRFAELRKAISNAHLELSGSSIGANKSISLLTSMVAENLIGQKASRGDYTLTQKGQRFIDFEYYKKIILENFEENEKGFVTTTEIYETLLDTEGGHLSLNKIGQALSQMGFEKYSKRVNDLPIKGYALNRIFI